MAKVINVDLNKKVEPKRDKVVLDLSDEDVRTINAYLDRNEAKEIVLESRRLFGVPEQGFNITSIKEIERFHYFKDGNLIFYLSFLGDEIKDYYKNEFSNELDKIVFKLLKNISKIEYKTLYTLLICYIFYGKLFLFRDGKTGKSKIIFPSDSISLEDFKKNILGEDGGNMSQKEIEAYYTFSTHLFNVLFDKWKK